MYTFIKSALVLLLLAAAAFYPGVQAKPAGHPVHVEAPKDVIPGSIVLWQVIPGELRATWNLMAPGLGTDSYVALYDVTANTWPPPFFTPNNFAVFSGLTSGHTYLVSVAHGQNVDFNTIVVF